MPKILGRRPKQILILGQPLPVVIDCVPHIILPTMTKNKFQTTSWSLVRAAAGAPTTSSKEALAELCQKYWLPVYSFIRRNGYDREKSQDLTQGFFALLIEKQYLLDTDRKRGKFRSFLLTAVKHFLVNEWDRENALKRGGGKVMISMDIATAEKRNKSTAMEAETPESLFERRWVYSLLEIVMTKLQAEFADAGKADEFKRLSPFLIEDSKTGRYKSLAEEMKTSEGALRMSVHRIRRRYLQILRTEIADTVAKPEDIDEELRYLYTILSS